MLITVVRYKYVGSIVDYYLFYLYVCMYVCMVVWVRSWYAGVAREWKRIRDIDSVLWMRL